MSRYESFWVCQLAITATSGLLIAIHQQEVSATDLSSSKVANDVAISQINQRLTTKIFPPIILAQAQLPNPNTPRRPIPPVRDPETEPAPPIELDPSPPAITPGLSDIPGTITVKEFKFEGNSAFDDEILSTELKKLTGNPISFAELLQAEEIIKDKYTAGCIEETEQRCYINSGAFIPANQTFSQENAIVTIRVVEGGVENIEINGLKKLQESYVRNRIQRGISQPLERDKLLDQLQILQLDPLIQNISAELAAGTRPDKSVLEINVTEADPFFTELFIDNARAPSVGSFRRGIRFSEGNLLGFGDRLRGEYVNTDGSNAVDLSYSVSITVSNTTVGIKGGVTATEVVEEPFDRTDIEGFVAHYYYTDNIL